MNAADYAHWHSIASLDEANLDAHAAETPNDVPLVDALRALRLAASVNERASAIRARDRVYQERALAVFSAAHAANRDWRPTGGPGRCPHGALLEECEHPSCALDIEAWTRAAMGRHRNARWLRSDRSAR